MIKKIVIALCFVLCVALIVCGVRALIHSKTPEAEAEKIATSYFKAFKSNDIEKMKALSANSAFQDEIKDKYGVFETTAKYLEYEYIDTEIISSETDPTIVNIRIKIKNVYFKLVAEKFFQETKDKTLSKTEKLEILKELLDNKDNKFSVVTTTITIEDNKVVANENLFNAMLGGLLQYEDYERALF